MSQFRSDRLGGVSALRPARGAGVVPLWSIGSVSVLRPAQGACRGPDLVGWVGFWFFDRLGARVSVPASSAGSGFRPSTGSGRVCRDPDLVGWVGFPAFDK